jgi:CheY-like chemotaxis protein
MQTRESIQPRLLIVDHRDILHPVYAGCTVAVGFQVERARDNDQALAKAALLTPHIVLTDCSAETGGAGVEFCRRLKRRLSTSRIPVLGLIADGDAMTADAVAAGCTVLAKPVSPERLLVEIVRVLGVWPPGPIPASRGDGTPTVEHLTQMLGRVLGENAQLVQRNADLAASAQLWANWYERVLERANHVSAASTTAAQGITAPTRD